MVSSTQQTQRIRNRKARKAGVASKRKNRAHGTPKFDLQPEGYDPTAADAKPVKVAVPAPAAKKKKPAATAAKKKK